MIIVSHKIVDLLSVSFSDLILSGITTTNKSEGFYMKIYLSQVTQVLDSRSKNYYTRTTSHEKDSRLNELVSRRLEYERTFSETSVRDREVRRVKTLEQTPATNI